MPTMAKTKSELPANSDVLASAGLSSKTITGASVYRHGSVCVVELTFSGGSSFIKVKGLEIEVGGTNEWGTGTIRA
jgi:hypothetical protein